MSLFTIADLHLSLGVDKPMDIFGPEWENHTQRLREAWSSIVGKEDTVVLPGDFSWGMNLNEALPDFVFLQQLPGKKILLKGNHDYWWGTASKIGVFFQENGLDSIEILHNNARLVNGIAVAGTRGWVLEDKSASPEDEKIISREAGRLEISLKAAKALGDYPIAVFLHFPVVYGEIISESMLRLLEEYGVKCCYYGHLHAHARARAFEGEFRGVSFKLVSADHLKFAPIPVLL